MSPPGDDDDTDADNTARLAASSLASDCFFRLYLIKQLSTTPSNTFSNANTPPTNDDKDAINNTPDGSFSSLYNHRCTHTTHDQSDNDEHERNDYVI